MQMRVHFLAATLALALGGCNGPNSAATGGQPNPGPVTDGGYGPFGGDTPPVAASGPIQGGGAEGVVSGAGGDAPPEFQTLITNYLNDNARQIAAGWPQVSGVPDAITGLRPGGEHRWQVRLRGGQPYAFIGACDNECSDIDLILEDASGVQIDMDVLPDDYPLVEVTPPSDGAYTVRIQLKTCAVGPCYVGARLVRRP